MNEKVQEVKNNGTQKLIFENANGQKIEVICETCSHCKEIIPKVEKCSDCGTEYVHWRTTEVPETGFLHFVYKCSGCPRDLQKAQKILKATK